jgi:hypothetical protein
MSAPTRASRISKLQTLLKKAYKPIVPVDNRPLLEHLLYASLLENAPYELADEALARLEQDYFDWNEVRVTTITELAEVLGRLPDPQAAAVRLKKNLHSMFESTYSFDLEELRKLNLGKAVQKFERLPSMTPFVLAYITQHGLGGHAIPLDSAALRFFWLADIINEKELKTGRITGLERAIPKNKGVEFASLLHQAAVAINMDPNDAAARKIVLALNPDLDQKVADHVAAVKERRQAKAKAKAEAAQSAAAEQAAPKGKAGKAAAAGGKSKATAPKDTGTPERTAKRTAAKTQTGAGEAAKKSPPKKPASKPAAKPAPKPAAKKAAKPKSAKAAPTKKASAASAKKKPSAKKTAASPAAKKKSASPAKAAKPAKKKPSSPAKPAAKKSATGGNKTATKSSGKRISKRKPR